MSEPKAIEIEVWHKEGGMIYNTDCLPITHKMHPYNQIKTKGLSPEDYGIEHPHTVEFESKSRNDLIEEILHLREELLGFHRAGF